MTPTQHEKNEWARMSRCAYAKKQDAIGDRFSFASIRASMTVAEFDALQSEYREWLINGGTK